MSSPRSAGIDDCWNRIGVQGDGSCPRLDVHIHCRNCPVFTRAATELLDRPLAEDYLAERTREIGLSQPAVESGGIVALVFRLGGEWLALPAKVCLEVTENLRPHTIPSRRNGLVLGLVNVRGELVISVSLDRLFGILSGNAEGGTIGGGQRLVIIEKYKSRFAFPVLEVSGLRTVLPSEIEAIPATLASSPEHYVRDIFTHHARSVGLIDDELLFFALNRSLA